MRRISFSVLLSDQTQIHLHPQRHNYLSPFSHLTSCSPFSTFSRFAQTSQSCCMFTSRCSLKLLRALTNPLLSQLREEPGSGETGVHPAKSAFTACAASNRLSSPVVIYMEIPVDIRSLSCLSLRQRTSRRKPLQQGTPYAPRKGARQGHCTVHYLPKGVIIRGPAAMERAARRPERGHESPRPLPPAVCRRSPAIFMGCDMSILQNV